MATAIPGIMINSLHGRLGNLVFYMRKGTQCVRVHVIPRNPDTEAQRAMRRSFADAVRSWQAMSADERYAYNRKARYLNMSGYNLYISNYLKRIIQTLVRSSSHESKSKLYSLPWNLEHSTWNFLSYPSVSKPYINPYGINAYPGCPKLSPG